MNVTLRIDNRERCKDVLIERVGSTECMNLDLGDYQFVVNGECILVIERKSIADLEASIMDGRFHEQKARLLGCYPSQNILYIIEGDTRDARKVNIRSALIGLCVRDRITFMSSGDVQTTVDILCDIYKKIGTGSLSQEPSTHCDALLASVKMRKKENITPESFFKACLSCVPGISLTTAGRLYDHFGNLHAMLSTLELRGSRYAEELDVGTTRKKRRLGKLGAALFEYFGIPKRA